MTPALVVRAMRVPPAFVVAVLAVAATALAGCTTPGEEEVDPLFGLCPQWAQGGGKHTFGLSLAGNGSERRELGPANETFTGKPLDLYRVHLDKLVVDGRTELRASSADGKALPIRDYRQPSTQLIPFVVFTNSSAAGYDFDVFLSSVAHGSTPAEAPVTLEWRQVRGEAQVDASVTFHYKVCGAEV